MWCGTAAGLSRDTTVARALSGSRFCGDDGEIGLSPLEISRSSRQALAGSEEKQIHPPSALPKEQAGRGVFVVTLWTT